MRIVAGTARGRPIKAPKSLTTRPTSDRVRESLFNILGQWMEGLEVLDLYAGSGALGLEAVSRGADRALLVDKDRQAVQCCIENGASLGFMDRVEVWPSLCDRAVQRLAKEGRRFDLIFADPPYALKAVASLLEQVNAAALLNPNGRLVVEHGRDEESPEPIGMLSRIDFRSFGDTRVSFYQRLDPQAPTDDTAAL